MTTPQHEPDYREPVTTKPIYSLAAVVVFVTAMTVLYVTGKDGGAGVLIAVAASTLPSLCAALYSERTARDVRNGTIRKKAREGALEAIESSGVMTRTGPVATAQLAALNALLTEIHGQTQATGAAVQDVRAAVADQGARAANGGEPQ